MLSVSLLVVMLMLQTPVLQLMKLPVLIEHYSEHKNLVGGNIDILDYLANHYLSDVKQGDYERDMQLPFKEDSPSFLMMAYYASRTIELPPLQPRPNKQDYISYRPPFHATESLADVWQPPRVLLYA